MAARRRRMTELARLCGRLVIGGFPSETLPPELERALRQGRRGGAILFRRNLPSIEDAHALCAAIARAGRASPDAHPPLLGID